MPGSDCSCTPDNLSTGRARETRFARYLVRHAGWRGRGDGALPRAGQLLEFARQPRATRCPDPDSAQSDRAHSDPVRNGSRFCHSYSRASSGGGALERPPSYSSRRCCLRSLLLSASEPSLYSSRWNGVNRAQRSSLWDVPKLHCRGASLRQRAQHVDGDVIQVVNVESPPVTGAYAFVTVSALVPAHRIVRNDRSLVEALPAGGKLQMILVLHATPIGWRARAVQDQK